jgi:hypothetical protein
VEKGIAAAGKPYEAKPFLGIVPLDGGLNWRTGR